MAKINELVVWVNDFETNGISYNDLSDKPKIDNVELSADTGMKDFQLQLAQFPNETAILELFETVAQNKAAEVAAETAESKVQEQLGVDNAKTAGIQPQDDFKLFIYAKNELEEEVRYSLNLDELAEYVNVYLSTQRSVVGG